MTGASAQPAAPSAGAKRTTPPAAPLTVGVEEEFLLVDPDGRTGGTGRRGRAGADGAAAARAGPARVPDQPDRDRQRPGHGLERARPLAAAMRRAVADAAERAGVRLLAVGTAPMPAGTAATVVDTPRFHRMVERFGDALPRPGL